MQPIEYVIFDMDGLLMSLMVETQKSKQHVGNVLEHLIYFGTHRIYTDITNEILAPYGKEMNIDIKAELMGKSEKDSAKHLLSFFPDINLTVDQYITEQRQKQDALWPTVAPLPGALKLLQHLHDHSIPIAIATGSARRKLPLKTSHLPHMFDLFDGHIVCGDEIERGKPFPDIFLAAAARLGRRVGQGDYTMVDEAARLERSKGLIFEDAILGVKAGIRAGMQVIWVPDVRLSTLSDANDLTVGETLVSLETFLPEKWGLPPYPILSSSMV